MHIEECDVAKSNIRAFGMVKMKRAIPAGAMGQILTLRGKPHSWRGEQCGRAGCCAYAAEAVVSHTDLAAESYVKLPMRRRGRRRG